MIKILGEMSQTRNPLTHGTAGIQDVPMSIQVGTFGELDVGNILACTHVERCITLHRGRDRRTEVESVGVR